MPQYDYDMLICEKALFTTDAYAYTAVGNVIDFGATPSASTPSAFYPLGVAKDPARKNDFGMHVIITTIFGELDQCFDLDCHRCECFTYHTVKREVFYSCSVGGFGCALLHPLRSGLASVCKFVLGYYRNSGWWCYYSIFRPRL